MFIQARKHESSTSLVNSPRKWPVTREMFPFDEVIMCAGSSLQPCNVPHQHMWTITSMVAGYTNSYFKRTLGKEFEIILSKITSILNKGAAPGKMSMAQCKTAVTPLLTHWSYCSLLLSHWYISFTPNSHHIPHILLQWCHNEHDGISSHHPHNFLLKPLFRQGNIKAPRHWPMCGEFTGDRWIPRTKGQWRGKCFHLMMSWW